MVAGSVHMCVDSKSSVSSPSANQASSPGISCFGGDTATLEWEALEWRATWPPLNLLHFSLQLVNLGGL